MNQEFIRKLIELIVEEVVRRVTALERQKQHPEAVLVLLAGPVARPEALKQWLQSRFGVGYTPVTFSPGAFPEDELTLDGKSLSQEELLARTAQARTVVLAGPRLDLLGAIARGEDRELLACLMIRSILWNKDVRLCLDFEPPRFRRNTFLEGVAQNIETLEQMGVSVSSCWAGDRTQEAGLTLVTEAVVAEAARSEDKTLRCRAGAIITPAARDALMTCDVIVQYEGETVCS